MTSSAADGHLTHPTRGERVAGAESAKPQLATHWGFADSAPSHPMLISQHDVVYQPRVHPCIARSWRLDSFLAHYVQFVFAGWTAMLEQLCQATFAEHLGTVFQIQAGHSQPIKLRLFEATVIGAANPQHQEMPREPFSLLFHGPQNSCLPQRIYQLTHEKLPALDLFLVPIGPDEHGMRYQAIFT